MNFNVINVSETNELWLELESAKNNNEPIIIFNWSPNFTDALYGGEFISFPEYHDDCENDPTWGINSNSTHDCGSKSDSYLKKIAWSGMRNKWPLAYTLLEKINFDKQMIGEMALYLDINQMEPHDAAKNWIDES